ncbi:MULTISPECIES: Ldh family oxidoreductase [Mesorhizobium]|uniref:Ldh family oxidoreductase n=1 Tax=Mesorhizobium denitrificans TaxID=2294114 RepID=A0A371XJH4_9HYPH|nr:MULTISPECIES: Ldh family oxidoreductase [Mesorhizobium]RFC69382.1 Ldh family oxidoreductase [Mesorhizobium denitrificans]
MAPDSETIQRIAADDMAALASAALQRHAVPQHDSEIIANCLVHADLRGVETHGVVRLPGYIDRLRRGLINPAPVLEPRMVGSVAASLDAQNGFGFVAATKATELAINIATQHGVALVSVHASNHFGMAATYVQQAVNAGFVCFVFSNASPTMPPWGGRTPIFGTNPLAFGAPNANADPFILDMSPAVAARGKIRAALRNKTAIPLGYALDSEGRPTTDPAAALAGVVLPVGGHKGAGLAIMVDILAGLMSGAGFAGSVGNQYGEDNKPQDVGHFFILMRPDLFIPREEYDARMCILIETVQGCLPAEGFASARMPGEASAENERTRRLEGIPYEPALISTIKQLAAG